MTQLQFHIQMSIDQDTCNCVDTRKIHSSGPGAFIPITRAPKAANLGRS